MLIRNIRSNHDLEARKKLQAEILQMQIDNEALLEQRVGDYKNPNKPPPVPPSYKTSSEIQKDSLAQMKEAIDNFRSLDLDFQVSSQIAQDLTKLPDGDANLIKLNKNFPFIKTDITKRFNVKYLDAQVLVEYLKEYFAELDSSIGINLAGSSSTNYFGKKPMNAVSILPSAEDFADLRDAVRETFDLFANLNVGMVQTIDAQLTGMVNLAPTNDELTSIDTFPIIERQRLNKQVERLVKVYQIPTSSFVYDVLRNLEMIAPQGAGAGALGNALAQGLPAQQPVSPQELQHTLAVLQNTLGHIDIKAQDKLAEFRTTIAEQQQIILATQAGLLNQPVPQPNLPNAPPIGGVAPPANLPNAQALRNHIIADNRDYIRNITNLMSNTRARVRLTDARTAGSYGNEFLNQVATTDGGVPTQANTIFEFSRGVKGSFKPLNPPTLFDGTPVDVATIARPLANFLLVARLDKGNPVVPNADDTTPMSLRYTKGEITQIIRDREHPVLFDRLTNDGNYDPKHNVGDRLIPEQGFGIKNKVKNVGGMINPLSNPEFAKKYFADKKIYDEEHSIKKEGGFLSRRIKIGKGVSVADEPKYREFGKYIVHIPQLKNDNVLNIKFPSTGTIPSIKPVNVDENYKQFFLDVLESGKVNQRHYDSLTEPEKSHFTKVARGAKVMGVLQIKPNDDDEEVKDIKRLELLFGEINAGNDNDKMVKECKMLIKKYIANGRINKNKGLEMLMELE